MLIIRVFLLGHYIFGESEIHHQYYDSSNPNIFMMHQYKKL